MQIKSNILNCIYKKQLTWYGHIKRMDETLPNVIIDQNHFVKEREAEENMEIKIGGDHEEDNRNVIECIQLYSFWIF